jgi:hypothetical protein
MYEIFFGKTAGGRPLRATKCDIKIMLKRFLQTCFEYDKVKKDEGCEACIGAKIGAIRILMEKPEGKRLPERPIRRWEDNFKMDLR